jgi:chaperonin GroES
MHRISEPLDLDTIITSPNIAEYLSEEDLSHIGRMVHEEWEIDKESRSAWEEKTKVAFNLALQVVENKTFPWSGASNVKFPLVTIAALQYQARAYPALIPDTQVVKCRVIGDDPDGLKALRANRVSEHMSFQLLEEDEAWEEHMDRALIHQAIVGCAFKKSYFDPSLSHNVSEHVLAKDLYIPYFAPSIEKAPRITQIVYMSQNDLYERYNRGVFLDWNKDANPSDSTDNVLDSARMEAQGVREPAWDPSQPYEILEQHRWLDLDCDGYQEPYVVYVRRDTQKVLRIVARFQSRNVQKNTAGNIISIKADNYFTKFPFIPSPDGGIYDLGFGVLLGPLNESINTSINQLIDAGTLSNTAGGFLGRGVKLKSGDNSFRPFEWKRVESTGDDLKKGIFPLPVREPSKVLFELLGLMINYGERIGMATDPQVGVNPGQNTPAETSRNMISEGQRVLNAIYKRTYRALKEEFRKLYCLNSLFLDDVVEFFALSSGQSKKVLMADYAESPKDIVPAADPYMVSDGERLLQANMLKSAAATTPGYNTYEVEKTFLRAMKISNIEAIYPDPQGPNAIETPPDTKVIIEGMKNEVKKLEISLTHKRALAQLMAEFELNQAKIENLRADATWTLAEAQNAETSAQIGQINAAVNLIRAKQDGITKAMEILMTLDQNRAEGGNNVGLESDNPAGVQRMAELVGDDAATESVEEAAGVDEGGMV